MVDSVCEELIETLLNLSPLCLTEVSRGPDVLHVVEALDDAAGPEVVLETADRSKDWAGALVLIDPDVPQPGVGGDGHVDGGDGEDDGELAWP